MVSNRFKCRWTNEMISTWIHAMKQHKSEMDFNNFNFNSNKTKQYVEVRYILSHDYNSCYFGVSRSKDEAGPTKEDRNLQMQ